MKEQTTVRRKLVRNKTHKIIKAYRLTKVSQETLVVSVDS